MPSDSDSASALKDADAVITAVADHGLLFLSDPKRANAFTVLTGTFPRGSWWSHPQANAIYDILQAVEQHPDVLFAKLLAGKVTLVHRKLWPALLAVVTAREPWQLRGLSTVAQAGLAALDEAAAANADVPSLSRTVVKDLEERLLAHGESVHTTAGKHETRLTPWPIWAARTNTQPLTDLAAAKATLATAAARLGPPPVEVPWHD